MWCSGAWLRDELGSDVLTDGSDDFSPPKQFYDFIKLATNPVWFLFQENPNKNIRDSFP